MKIYELIKHLEVLPDQQADIYMFDGCSGRPVPIIDVDEETLYLSEPNEKDEWSEKVQCIL